jgi:hypothetical protein
VEANVVQIEPIGDEISERFFAGEQVSIAFTAAMSSEKGLRMKSGFESAFEIQPLAGTGSFEKREDAPSAPVLNGSATDLDSDGVLDVVATHEGSTEVTVYFNGPRGLFRDTLELQTGLLDPGSMTITDVDKDGSSDIVIIDRILPSAAILFNESLRNFSAPTHIALSPDAALSRPVALATADWNGDGLVDVATANRLTDDVTLALNASGRVFRSPVRIPVGHKPVAIAGCDIDGNSVPDLLTVNTRSDTVSLFINDGKGSFLKKEELQLLYGDPRQVVARDLNRDGAVDLLIVDPSSRELVRFQNNGDGTFRRPDYFPVDHAPRHVAVADVNADGSVDLLVGHSQGVIVLRGASGGTFESQPVATLSTGFFPIPGDFDGDGAIDLVIAGRGPASEAGLTFLANGRSSASGNDGTILPEGNR